MTDYKNFIIVGLMLIAFLIPLGELPKYFGLAFSGIKVIVLLTLFAAIAYKAVKKEAFFKTPLDIPLLFFVFAFLPSFYQTSDFLGLLLIVATIVGYWVLIMLIVNFVVDKNSLIKIIVAFLFSTLLVSIFGFIQFKTGKTFLSVIGREELYRWGETLVLLGTERNPNAFANHFVVAIPLAFSLIFAFRRTIIKSMLSAGTIIYAITLLLTLSRSAIIGVVAGIGSVLFFFIKKKRKLWLSFLLILLVGVTLSYFWQMYPQYSLKAMFGTETDLAIETKVLSTYERIPITVGNLLIFQNNPLIGVGFGNSQYEITKYVNIHQVTPHNNFLGIASELGLIGLIPFLLIIVICIKVALTGIKYAKDPLLLGLLVGLFGSFVAQHIFGLFHMNYVSVSLWLVTGLLLAGAKIAKKEALIRK